jgi:hypothetical protein
MPRRVLIVVAVAALAAGGTALAQGGGTDPYELPEPKVRDSAVLQLASSSGCVHGRHLRVRFTPPPGAVFGWFQVTVDGRRAVRLTGVPRAASATVTLPRGRSVVRVEGETLGGQRVASAGTYRTCARPTPRPTQPPPDSQPDDTPIQQGGGED